MEKNRRSSHCIKCGKRVSAITATGAVRWQPSQVDDAGLVCLSCYEARGALKTKKNSKTSA
jgi:hypothetical protein